MPLVMLFPRGCANHASPRNLFRLASKNAQNQRSSFAWSCLRSAQLPTRTNPAQLRAVNTKNALSQLPARKPNLTAEQQRAAHRADKMYQEGKTALFRAPSHFGYLLGSWLLGLGCISGSLFMLDDGHWKEDPNSPFPWFVPVAYRLSILIMAGLGFWVLWQSRRLVTAIDLVEVAGERRMRVSIHRIVPFPFVPPRRLLIAPYDLQLPEKAIRPGQVPRFAEMPQEDNRSRPLRFGTWVGKKISFSLWSFFASQRKIMTHEGFMTASIKGQTEFFKIDIAGTFPYGARSLIDVSTQHVG